MLRDSNLLFKMKIGGGIHATGACNIEQNKTNDKNTIVKRFS